MSGVHCHIFSGQDDGPTRMADQCVRITIAIPQQLSFFRSGFSSQIQGKTNELNACLVAKGVDLTIFIDAELRSMRVRNTFFNWIKSWLLMLEEFICYWESKMYWFPFRPYQFLLKPGILL